MAAAAAAAVEVAAAAVVVARLSTSQSGYDAAGVTGGGSRADSG
jgi:hypothetical protein